jgi:hypothetical protein
MGKNHNQNQANNRLQEIALRNLVRGRDYYRNNLILKDPKASIRIEAYPLPRKQFLAQAFLNTFQAPVDYEAKNNRQINYSRIIFM